MKIKNILEETIINFPKTTFSPGPLWGYGSSTVIKKNQFIYVSIREVDESLKSLCNSRWRIFRKNEPRNWSKLIEGQTFDQREPCPIIENDGFLFISLSEPNETRYITENNKQAQYCTPQIKKISNNQIVETIFPKWDACYQFNEHSYRGISIDSVNNNCLLLNINSYDGYAWSLINLSNNKTINNGYIKFPIRGAYPQISIKDNFGAILSIQDIFEPNLNWRKYKFTKSNSSWDYVFRQLYYCYSNDVTKDDFSPILTIADVDDTSGHIRNMDLYIDQNKLSHILYIERNVWPPIINQKYFPKLQPTISLKYCQISEGKIIERKTILTASIYSKKMIPNYAGFINTPDNQLFVLINTITENKTENHLMKIFPTLSDMIYIDLKQPLENFVIANERNGSDVSSKIAIIGLPKGWRYKDLYYGVNNDEENAQIDTVINYVQFEIFE